MIQYIYEGTIASAKKGLSAKLKVDSTISMLYFFTFVTGNLTTFIKDEVPCVFPRNHVVRISKIRNQVDGMVGLLKKGFE